MAPALTPVDEALAAILAASTPSPTTETRPLSQALGRVLAADLRSAVDVPPGDNSAMDGYAVRYADLVAGEGAAELVVAQRIAAGQIGTPLKAGTAARIFTGAAIPDGADTVVIQEETEVHGSIVRVLAEPRRGQHIRPRGQDIPAGGRILRAGKRLQPQDIGVLASTGITEVSVYRPLRVALVSTGDELVEPGEPLAPGQIYNSNRYTLSALLTAMGCDVVDGGIVADEPDRTREQLLNLAGQADLLLSSGGVSVGEEDHVKAALEALGELSLWKLNIKPGKPLAFGHIRQGDTDTPFFGLPGNPTSAFVTFALIARPYILRCQGQEAVAPTVFRAVADFDWRRPGSRQEYLRARVEHRDGEPRVKLYPNQSSGVLLSTSWANALVVLAPGEVVQAGSAVNVIPLSELISA